MDFSVNRTIQRYESSVPRYLSAVCDVGQRHRRSEDGLDRGDLRGKGSSVDVALDRFNQGMSLRPHKIHSVQKSSKSHNEMSVIREGIYNDDCQEDDAQSTEDEEEEDECECECECVPPSCQWRLEAAGHEEDNCRRKSGGEDIAFSVLNSKDRLYKDEQRASKTINFFYQLFKQQQLCDLVVRLGKREFPCHSITLVEHSDKYYNLLCGGRLPLQEIELEETTTTEAVEAALDYVYTGEIHLDECQVVSVLDCARQLDLNRLVEKCLEYLQWQHQNCMDKKTRQTGVNRPSMIHQRFSGAGSRPSLNSAEFLNLDADSVCNILAEDEIDVERESDVFQAAIRWLEFRKIDRQCHILKILQCVRFQLMLPTELATIVEHQHQLMRMPQIKELLNQAYKYHALVLSRSLISTDLPAPQIRSFTSDAFSSLPNFETKSKQLRKATSLSSGYKQSAADRFNFRSLPGISKLTEPVQRSRAGSNNPTTFITQKPPLPRGPATQQQRKVQLCSSNPTSTANPRVLRGKHNETVQPFTKVHRGQSKSTPVKVSKIPTDCSNHSFDCDDLADDKGDSDGAEEDDDSSDSPVAKICLRKKPKVPDPPTCVPQLLTNRIPLACSPVLNQDIYVFGGTDLTCGNPDRPGRQVLKLDTVSKKWDSVSTLMPVPRNNHCVAVIDTIVYIIGGALPVRESEDFFAQPTNSLLAFDTASCEWFPKTPMEKCRLYFAVTTWKGKIFVFGGQGTGNSVLDSVELYDPVYDQWKSRMPMSRGGRVGACAAGFRDKIFVIGGYAWFNGVATALHLSSTYDPITDCWCELCPLDHGLCYAGLIEAADQLYLIGGAESGTNETQPLVSIPYIRIRDPATDKWKTISELRIPRHDSSVITLGKKIYVIGGLTLNNRPLASVECYDTDNDILLARLPDLPAPSAGTAACVVPQIST